MNGLEKYVTEELPEDEAILQQMNEAIKGAVHHLIYGEFKHQELGPLDEQHLWPYVAIDKQRIGERTQAHQAKWPGQGASQSTTALVAAALLPFVEKGRTWLSTGYRWGKHLGPQQLLTEAELTQVKKRIEIARDILAKRWSQPGKTDPENQKPRRPETDYEKVAGTVSTTFGLDDIHTLSRHLDIFQGRRPHSEQIIIELQNRLDEQSEAGSTYEREVWTFNRQGKQCKRIVSNSAYNLVRFVRCLRHITPTYDTKKQPIVARFEDRMFSRFRSLLHDQLSYSAIKDSRFDPAELAYCLEGMLQLRQHTIDEELLSRVMSVLDDSQKRSPEWQSRTPVVAYHKGSAVYPSAVEAAISVLTSLSILDSQTPAHAFHSSVASKHIRLIKRYWGWLFSRATRIIPQIEYSEPNPRDELKKGILGWHSEHFNDPSIVHLWETSKALEFMCCFRDQLQQHIARRLLVESRLKVHWPKMPKDASKKPLTSWDEISANFEPVPDVPDDYKIYNRIDKDFVNPADANKQNWSMLLYGPPGTGKSTVATNIAATLEVPSITVTVGDFLAEGDARMEWRAKMLFEVLERQPFSIVLMDEVDQFFLDRDSKMFLDQETAFQFLTPGMLTKLANLRSKENIILVVATNYEERIDLAIKRPGRIDKKYLLLPPNGKKRLNYLETWWDESTQLVRSANIPQRTLIKSASAFLGFKDLETVAKSLSPTAKLDDLIEKLKNAARNIQFSAYPSRFGVTKDNKAGNMFAGPTDELMWVIWLAAEDLSPRPEDQPDCIKRLKETLEQLQQSNGWDRFGKKLQGAPYHIPPKVLKDLGAKVK